MDTITHGIAGALMGKALFGGRDLVSKGTFTRPRIVTWSLMLGAIFPDVDVVRDIVSKDPMLIVTWHRSITHSLICLPIWAVLLAGLSRWLARAMKWDAPSFMAFTGLYAIGVLSHILLDLVTTFGTMIWSPLAWSRPAWDLIFIIDLTLTAILLVPQLVAWTNTNAERAKVRMLVFGAISLPLPWLISMFLQNVGAPISTLTTIVATAVLGALFVLPVLGGRGARVPYAMWSRAGLAAACVYIGGTVFAHQAALQRVQKFAELEHLQVDAIGALPIPPSLWHWDGLVRTSHGVYEFRTDLAVKSAFMASENAAVADPIEYNLYPDAPGNRFIDLAKQVPEVQKVLWFARFPVVRFHQEGAYSVVEFSDARFPAVRRNRPAAFTYRVRFDASGTVVAKGWLRN
jgi:membrane-bound metal-dependent hydrolase YbcI (DUF457 family)